MRREGGFTGTLHPPVPDKPEGISRRHREAAIYRRSPGCVVVATEPPLARSRVMLLQSSKERKVNGITSAAICSPHPSPLPQGRGSPPCRYYFVGNPQPCGRGNFVSSSFLLPQ
ncbi:hypothetical protein KIF59_23825 [Enterobacter cloacae subsp. cloacae]|nr:hypothetical protein [Enterobacter cloacae subsp. cloacae]